MLDWGKSTVAKRYTDTDKWKNPWYRKLPSPLRELWNYILDGCDHAGIWRTDFELAAMIIGVDSFTPEQAIQAYGDRIVVIDHDKWFIPSFIEFQYGKLTTDDESDTSKKKSSKVHNSVVQILIRNGINPKDLTLINKTYGTDTLSKGYGSGSDTTKDKDKDKEKDKVKDQDKENQEKSEIQKNPEHVNGASELVALWHEHCPKLATVTKITDTRKRKVSARLTSEPTRTYWETVFKKIALSPFLMGDSGSWKASFDWIIDNDNNAAKVNEGVYDRNNGATSKGESDYSYLEDLA